MKAERGGRNRDAQTRCDDIQEENRRQGVNNHPESPAEPFIMRRGTCVWGERGDN